MLKNDNNNKSNKQVKPKKYCLIVFKIIITG